MPTANDSFSARYTNPFTRHGVNLTRHSHGTPGGFILHESGFLPEGTNWKFPGVLSPFWRLYANGAKGWNVVHAGKRWPLQPEGIVLVPDGVLFDCVGDTGVPHLWLHFSPAQPLDGIPRSPISLERTLSLQLLASATEMAHRAASSPEGRQALFHCSMALLHATFAGIDRVLSTEHPEPIQHALRHIQQNLRRNLSNGVLAKVAAMAESVFIRQFRRQLDTTPAAYVQKLRIKEAAQRLVLSRASIDEIAAECGFPNRYYFTRVFKAHMGTGPAEYRRRQSGV